MTAVPMSGRRGRTSEFGPWPKKVDGRSGGKVLRDTRIHFDNAGSFFRKIEKQDRFAIIRGIWNIARTNATGRRSRGKSEGRRGDLYDLHALLLDWMISRSMNWRNGRLECTYAQMCKGVEMSRATIARLIKDLIRAGILQKLRRWRFNKDDPTQVEQAPNAYRIVLTNRLRAASGRCKPAAPKPTQHEVAETLRRHAAREAAALHFDRIWGENRPDRPRTDLPDKTDE